MCGFSQKRAGKTQISLSMAMVDQQTGRELAIAPELGSIHTGVVDSVHSFGSFVTIPGFAKQGDLSPTRSLVFSNATT
jgi:ribosomal protein S1